MKAAIYPGAGQPMVVEQLPDPVPGPDEGSQRRAANAPEAGAAPQSALFLASGGAPLRGRQRRHDHRSLAVPAVPPSGPFAVRQGTSPPTRTVRRPRADVGRVARDRPRAWPASTDSMRDGGSTVPLA